MTTLRYPRLIALVAAAALLGAACGTTEDDPASADNRTAEGGNGESGSNGAEGGESGDVLEPLDDGFPEGPITLWSAFDVGHTDDLFNNALAQAAERYSPVPVTTDARPIGPAIQFGLIDYLAEQQGGQDGYHVYAGSIFGASMRPYTQEVTVDRDPEELRFFLPVVWAPDVFAVPLDSPLDSLDEFIEHAEQNPDELTAVYGSEGGGNHAGWLVAAGQAGIEDVVVPLPTENVAEASNVMQGGGADIAVLNYEAGIEERFKLLAVAGDERMEAHPDVPALSEFDIEEGYGALRGLGTLHEVPDEHVEWLRELFSRVAQDQQFVELQEGFEIVVDMPIEEALERRDATLDLMVPELHERGLAVRNRE